VTLLRSRGALVAATAVVAVSVAACGSDGHDSGSATGSGTAGASSSSAEASTAAASAEPFGEDCSSVPADEPVVTAAGDDPALSTLVDAVGTANLTDSLNSQEDITVLAPADPAFEAVPADDLKALLADNARLTAVLTHHVIDGRLTPEQLAGEHVTLNGDAVTVEGSGEDFTLSAGQTVAGKTAARVICGNVQTANATVYVIDQVLTPPAR